MKKIVLSICMLAGAGFCLVQAQNKKSISLGAAVVVDTASAQQPAAAPTDTTHQTANPGNNSSPNDQK